MHHLPHGEAWDPARLSTILKQREILAVVDGSSVRIDLPHSEPHGIVSRLLRWVIPPKRNTITIAYVPEQFVHNIHVDYDPFMISTDLPHLHDITVALRECDYVVARDREIAALYCSDSQELEALFDKMEKLQRKKEVLVAEQDFESARQARDQERNALNEIDAFLFRRVGCLGANERRIM